MTETIRHATYPYFLLEQNGCALLAARVHIDPYMRDRCGASNPEGMITSDRASKTAGTMAFQQGAQTDAAPVTAMLEQMSANSRAGGWSKHKQLPGQRDVGV